MEHEWRHGVVWVHKSFQQWPVWAVSLWLRSTSLWNWSLRYDIDKHSSSSVLCLLLWQFGQPCLALQQDSGGYSGTASDIPCFGAWSGETFHKVDYLGSAHSCMPHKCCKAPPGCSRLIPHFAFHKPMQIMHQRWSQQHTLFNLWEEGCWRGLGPPYGNCTHSPFSYHHHAAAFPQGGV